MAGHRIHILSAGTWGEMGNQLAARALASVVEQAGHDIVGCGPIEEIAPLFATIGARIRALTFEAAGPQDRARRYLSLMNELAAEVFTPGFELTGGNPVLAPTIEAVAEAIGASGADVVIGTKGAITRIAVAAARKLDRPIAVVNHLTNHGLLRLPIHRATTAHAHMVQIEEARQEVMAHCDCGPERVFVLGAITAAENLAAMLTGGRGEAGGPAGRGATMKPVQLVILSNRGGPPFLEIASLLAASPLAARADVVFIDAADPAAVDAFNALAARHRLGWRGFGRLSQAEYLAELARLDFAQVPLLVSKPGPNTVMEALRIGVPCLLLDSGLPMEAWVLDYVRDKGFGSGADHPAALVSELSAIVAGERIPDWRDRIDALRRTLFRPELSVAAAAAAISSAHRIVHSAEVALASQ
ncbi:hypothetical protein Q9Q95_13065 [Sphingomonas sp. DG1-23]|uniref:hypothetical protein n=1 Tax=Sphingomonas sp. DG1-23 TaxID=3068316 RepID=UPI00273FFFA5|nr:hypothetical protein [Sphingomonas sp. DG1-23]MDP5279858.1 hypothetical protein [Sphingomonas sp. DG1-23]